MGRGGRGRDSPTPGRRGDSGISEPVAAAAGGGARSGDRQPGTRRARPAAASEGLSLVRARLVERLAALERERARQVDRGHPELARRTLRAFQELARILEYVDDLLGR